MALVTDKPEELRAQNDLDNIPQEALGPVPARLEMSGKTLLVMDEPPAPGDFLKVELTLKCKSDGRELLEGGEFVHFRKTALIAAKVTAEPYKPEPEPEPEPDPAMIGEDGSIPADDDTGDIDPDAA